MVLNGSEGDRFLSNVELGQRYRQEQQRTQDLADISPVAQSMVRQPLSYSFAS